MCYFQILCFKNINFLLWRESTVSQGRMGRTGAERGKTWGALRTAAFSGVDGRRLNRREMLGMPSPTPSCSLLKQQRQWGRNPLPPHGGLHLSSLCYSGPGGPEDDLRLELWLLFPSACSGLFSHRHHGLFPLCQLIAINSRHAQVSAIMNKPSPNTIPLLCVPSWRLGLLLAVSMPAPPNSFYLLQPPFP